MKIKTIIAFTLTVGLLAGCASEKCERCEKHHGDQQAKLIAQAKISQADAQATALAKVPGGTIKESEIEKEKGKLVWSFDLTTTDSKDIKEVNVDAITGEVVGNVETEAPETRENKD